MTNFETTPSSEIDRPSIEQLQNYRQVMIDIVRQQGKGVRQARIDERAKARIGTEYMLPGAQTDWSEPDAKNRSDIMRERRYSASFRSIGETAGRLLVLESESNRLNPERYLTNRNIYKFQWDEMLGVFESEILPIEIVSSTKIDGEVLPVEPYGIKDILALDHEQTAEATREEGGEYSRYINPLRDTVSPWRNVTESEFGQLIERTRQYGDDLLADDTTIARVD